MDLYSTLCGVEREAEKFMFSNKWLCFEGDQELLCECTMQKHFSYVKKTSAELAQKR